MEEFEPVDHLSRYLRLWWISVILALAGALVGFLFARSHPPIYEAVAVFTVTIDMNKVPAPTPSSDQNKAPAPLLELHDEDLALSATHGVLISQPVVRDVLKEAARLGWQADWTVLVKSMTIERRHAFWELRLRHTNPELAEQLVNFWAELGYQTMLSWQAEGKAQPYVVFSPPTLAGRPVEPVNYDTNRLVLAGSLVGWLIGLALVELVGARLIKKPSSPAKRIPG